MKETTKTNKEIFDEKYPYKELTQNPMICVEAIGYLKALIEYFPSEQKWADSYMINLMAIVLLHAL